MCSAIALSVPELPITLVRQNRLTERIHAREGHEEFQFHWYAMPTVLPVRCQGRPLILPWGSKTRRSPLPYGGSLSVEAIEAGVVAGARPEEVVIPATLGFQKGVWFVVNEGIRGVAIETRGGQVVYMLMQPSSNYYRNMTGQSPMMPVFVNQVI